MIDLQAIVRLAIRASEQTTSPKIEAIKWLRRALGVGLKEAKDMVEDAYMCGPVRFAEKHARIAGIEHTCPNRPLEDLEGNALDQAREAQRRLLQLASAVGINAEALLQPAAYSPAECIAQARVERRARELYEAGRKRVRGRPAWDQLDPNCPYDLGMKAYALSEAKRELAEAA
ncbi:ribosomal protein L7/L12 [Methylobacterium sp. yr596]|uniref:ribosomal protein L7/L12 n=1 Tax=Methylobacterium sp. yr596 TaxID=1761800 RepID=UPI0008E2C624|nr:ribosomal protein L7/L12 [Methylobacterium sp. yr596]SFF87928.1 Ribosomal protein L7/L12 C-terminal domain-containing protein [Methylobacterium sp. yr596]